MRCRQKRFVMQAALLCLFFLYGLAETASATITVTPNTWNIIGLDSNSPATGPSVFPVGAKVCSDVVANNVNVTFTWDSANANINLKAGSTNPIVIANIPAGNCVNVYFDVEVQKIAASFDTKRRYHITAGGISTPTPRELYVEHLISQNRNSINNIKLDGVSIPAGGVMNVAVGNTYTLELYGGTATQGYNQFEQFLNFPNSVFQVLSVSTSYSADSSPYVSNPNSGLYADACKWENDPNNPNYRACYDDYKAGGSNVVTTYTVKVIGGGGTSQDLNSLLYDFSGSSFHYNSDYTAGARILNINNPSTVTITKNFSPDPTNVNGISTLTYTITNPNAGSVSGVNFTHTFPTNPGNMVVANPTNASTNGCGTPTFAPVAAAGNVSFSNGTLAGNSSCVIKVNVTAPTTGAYTSTTNNVFIGTVDTGNSATDTLTVNNDPPPGTGVCGNVLASWDYPTGFNTAAPAATVANVTATAAAGGGVNPTDNTPTHSGTTHSWGTNGSITTGAFATGNNEYFEFRLDTTGVTTVFINFWAQRKINNSPQGIAVYHGNAAGNPETGTSLYNNSTVLAANTTWYEFGGGGSLSFNVTANTSYVRIYFFNSGNDNPGSDGYLDDVAFTGCNSGIAPTITKSFSPNPVAVNGASTLTFTLNNANAVQLTGAKFTDTLPAGLEVAGTPNAATTCGGGPSWAPAAGATTLNFGQTTGATIPASSNCTVSVDIKATTDGPHSNVSGFLFTTETGTNKNSTATATLTAVLPPSISMQYAPDEILAGGTTTITYLITNPNVNDALNGIAFSNTFPVAPGAMVVANPTNATTTNCGAPTFSPVAGAGTVSLTGGTIAAGGTCTVTVNVTAPTVGTYNNTTGNVSHTINAATVNGNTANKSLTVNPSNPSIMLLKQVGAAAAGPWSSFLAVSTGGNVYYKFTVENIGDAALTSIGVTDPNVNTGTCVWPANLPVAVAANDNHIATCVVGPVTATAGLHANTATASGTYNSVVYNDQSTATYGTTGLTILNSVTQTQYTAAGNVLNYSYLVTNSGNAALAGPVTVSDDKSSDETCPAVTTVGDGDTFLDAGEQITCTGTYTVTAGDVTAKLVTNTASATAGGVTSATSNTTVPLAPDLSAVATNNVNGVVGVGSAFIWTMTVSNSTSAGSAANFADTQTLITDDLPTTGETYSVGTVTKAATTGTINCTISSNVLTCKANGAVSIPAALQGTVSVTNGSATVTGTGTSFTTQLTSGSVLRINGVSYTVLTIQSNTQLTLTANYAGVTAAGISVPGGFSVPVTVTTVAARTLNNPKTGGTCRADSGAVVVEINEGNNDCSDTVTVQVAPGINMAFNPTTITTNGTSVLTLTLINPDPGTAYTNVSVTNAYPANLVNAAAPNGTTTCAGGVVTANAGGNSIQLTGATIPANTNCTVTVNVTSATAGVYVNTIAANTLTCAEGKTNLSAAWDTLNVLSPLVAAQTFTPNSVTVNNASVLKITLQNTNSVNITGVAFTDNYPAGLTNTGSANAAISGTGCAGTLTAANNGTSLTLTNATVPANTTCEYTVNIVSALAGVYNNSSGTVTTTNAGNTAAVSATLTVSPALNALAAAMSFTPISISVNNTSILKITLQNANAVDVTGAAFTDNYPANLVNTANANATISGTGCTGTLTGANNAAALSLANATVPANTTCEYTVNVTSATAGIYNNSSGLITTTNVGNTPAVNATLTVSAGGSINALAASMSFTPISITVNNTSVLKISLQNTNNVDVTGVSFTDSYPANIVNTGGANAAISGAGCTGNLTGANNAATLTLTNATIPANTTCEYTVNVTSATAGSYNNGSGTITSTNAGNTAEVSATLTVTNPGGVNSLAASMSFTPISVSVNNTSVLKITLLNTNNVDVTGTAFTDNYPANLVNTGNANPTITGAGCAGTLTGANNAATLSLTGAAVPANSFCEYTVNVTSANASVYNNSSGTITTTNAGNTASVSATLAVTNPGGLNSLAAAMSFTPIAVSVNNASALKITLLNLNTVDVTGAAFTNNYPANLVNTGNASPAISGAGCTGNLTGANNAATLTLTNATIPANGSCDYTVNVTSGTAAVYTNSSGAITTTNAGNTASVSATITVTAGALTPIAAAIAFTPISVNINNASSLKITLRNPNTVDVVGTAFTDNYPFGLVNTANATPLITGAGCAGTLTGTNNGASLTLTNATVPAGTTCEYTVNVTSATAASYTDSSGAFTTTNAGNTSAVSATLVVINPGGLNSLAAAMSFTPISVSTNNTSVLKITLLNTNAVDVTGAAFTNNYPANLVNTGNASPAITGAGCAGILTGVNNAAALSIANATIPANGSCDYTVNVTSATAAVYFNNIGTITSTNAGNTSSVNAMLAVTTPRANISIAKTVLTQSDPVNAMTNPKAIPAAEMLYTITATNKGDGAADAVVLTDSIPASTVFYAGDLNGAGSGPVQFADGATASGLSYAFAQLSSGADSVSFSNDGGITYTYTPVPDSAGYDSSVTHIKVSLTGTFNAANAGNNPSCSIKFKVKVK